ncbi:uncharacterized protein EAE97_007185 [Botrytis byssoidea]|uniref:Transcription factor domain-containing protein n=1 Tax=Botrytis byssoidea TaxID=139641 RepID=A0A9P5IET2_9HELO|nr:uncharacterized protein EAE97_007185 [Botrytis byssoidea]KAF7939104.1 hypothetical protein EAE97_007185 [Botrytis byssoidea]
MKDIPESSSMSVQDLTSEEEPMAIQFVSGRAKDEITQRLIRSHAMSAFRSKQRQQKAKRKISARKLMAVERSCEFSKSSLGSSSSSHNQQYGSGHDTSLEVTQVGLPSLFAFAPAQPDPSSSGRHPSPDVILKYSREVSTTKQLGPEILVDFPKAAGQALSTSIVYMIYAYLCSVRGMINDELATGLRDAAIAQIGQKLAQEGTLWSDATIASIAYFSTGIWAIERNAEEVEAHMTGVELLVKRRGLESFGVYPFGQTIRKYLVMRHIFVKAISAEELPLSFSNSSIRLKENEPQCWRFTSPLYCPSGSFESVRQLKGFDDSLIQVLYIAKDLIDLITGGYEQTVDNANHQSRLSVALYFLQPGTVKMGPSNLTSQYWIFESCRLATLIIFQAIKTCTPLPSCDEYLTSAMICAIERTDVDETWGDVLGILYWVSIIACASIQGRSDHGILDSRLGKTIFMIASSVQNFEYATGPAQKFAQMQMGLARRYELAAAGKMQENH